MKTTLFVLLLLIPAINGQAQIYIESAYITPSEFRNENGEKAGGEGNLKIINGGIKIPVSVKTDKNNKPIAWAVALTGTYASLDNKNLSEGHSLSEIINLQTGLMHLRPLSEKWSVLATAGVGLFTSGLRRKSGKTILGEGGVLIIRHAKPNFDWGAGVALNNALGYPMIDLYTHNAVKGFSIIPLAVAMLIMHFSTKKQFAKLKLN